MARVVDVGKAGPYLSVRSEDLQDILPEGPWSMFPALFGVEGGVLCSCGRLGEAFAKDSFDDAVAPGVVLDDGEDEEGDNFDAEAIVPQRNFNRMSLHEASALSLGDMYSAFQSERPAYASARSPPGAAEADVAEAPLFHPSIGNSLLLLPVIKQAVRSFHSCVARGLLPTPLEVNRGLMIERCFDFYDSATRQIRTLRMAESAVHTRQATPTQPATQVLAQAPDVDLPHAAALEEEEASPLVPRRRRNRRSSAGDAADVASAADAAELSPAELLSPCRTPNRRGSCVAAAMDIDAMRGVGRLEVATNWATLSGKLLHIVGMGSQVEGHDLVGIFRKRQSLVVGKANRVTTSVQRRAMTVVTRAKAMATSIGKDPQELFDSEWKDKLLTSLFGAEFENTLLILFSAARKVLASQPILAEAAAPCRVFGDIHGQLRDLLMLFHAFGMPDGSGGGTQYIFNGDWVDRGAHQLEVVGLLMAMKIAMPDRIWLIRGNHEDRVMNERYGFREVCHRCLGSQMGSSIYDKVHAAFDQLPLACLVEKRVLVVHGGIGDGKWLLADLLAIPRPLKGKHLEQPSNNWIFNILWSDPIEDDFGGHAFGAHSSPRGAQVAQFSWHVTKIFCARNGLSLVVRSHQSKKGSLGFDVMHENLLMRVFSARDYESETNDGAVLLITPSDGPAASPNADAAGGPVGPMLKVRPQVLRSVAKTREALRAGESGAESSGGSRPPTPPSSPAAARRRASVSGVVTPPLLADKAALSRVVSPPIPVSPPTSPSSPSTSPPSGTRRQRTKQGDAPRCPEPQGLEPRQLTPPVSPKARAPKSSAAKPS